MPKIEDRIHNFFDQIVAVFKEYALDKDIGFRIVASLLFVELVALLLLLQTHLWISGEARGNLFMTRFYELLNDTVTTALGVSLALILVLPGSLLEDNKPADDEPEVKTKS